MSQFPERPRQQPPLDQGDYNFAQGTPGQPYEYDFGIGQQPQYQPQQPQSTPLRRTILLGCGCVTTAIVVVCACLFGTMYMTRDAIPALMWVQMASGTTSTSPLDLEDATDFNIVCPGSQADLFTQRFLERYPGEVEIRPDENTLIAEEGANNTVGIEGTLIYEGEELDYEAVFYIDPDGESFVFFLGCINRIDQISPPLVVEGPEDINESNANGTTEPNDPINESNGPTTEDSITPTATPE